MAGEIFIADKLTLDSVKSDTNYIKNQFPISGGTDWHNYVNYFCNTGSTISAYSSVFKTIVDISGVGYLTKIGISFSGGSSGDNYTAVIEIDGKEFLKSEQLDYSSSGMSKIENKFDDNLDNTVAIFQTPIHEKNEMKHYCLCQPLFFNKSFKIKVKGSANIYLKYMGVMK